MGGRIWIAFGLATVCLLMNSVEGKIKLAKRAKRKVEDNEQQEAPADEPVQAVGDTRSGDAEELPKLAKLSEGEYRDGDRFNFDDCEIALRKDGSNNIQLDFEGASCKDIMSVPRVVEKVTNYNAKDVKRFVPLSKFNVGAIKIDTSSRNVSVQAYAKESFGFIQGTKLKIREGELALDFQIGDTMMFREIELDVSGQLTFSDIKAPFSLSKDAGEGLGLVDIRFDEINIAKFLEALTKERKLDRAAKAAISIFKKVDLVSPTTVGRRDNSGFLQFMVSGTANDIPGVGSASIYIYVTSGKGLTPKVGLMASFNEIKPADVIKKLAKNLTKADIENVPIINDVSIDMAILYATNEMGVPLEDDLLAALKDFTKMPMIEKGTRILFKLPLKKLIEKNQGEVPASVTQDYYVGMKICEEEISFDFGDTEIEIKHVLMALVPNFDADAFDKVFGNASVSFSSFAMNLETKAINIGINATDVVSLGDGFLTLDKANFDLRKDQRKFWEVSMEAEVNIGDGFLELSMSRTGEKKAEEETYKFAGTMERISTDDLVDYFNVKKVQNIIKQMPALSFTIAYFKAFAEYNADGDTNMRLEGKVKFFIWDAQFEGMLKKKSADIVKSEENEMAFGLVIQGVSICELSNNLFGDKGRSVKLPNADWLKGLTISLIVGKNDNDASITFDNNKLKGALSRAGVMPNGGAIFDSSLKIPNDCKGESVCEFLKKNLGKGAELFLAGELSGTKFALKAGISMDLKVTEKFTITEANLQFSVGEGDAEFGIEGACTVEFGDKTKREFRAKLAAAISGKFTMSFSTSGPLWTEVLGIKHLAIGNFAMEAGINVLTLAPAFEMAGEMHVGQPGNAIKAKLAGGFDSAGSSPGFFFYAKFNKLTVGSILQAFNIEMDLPRTVKEIGFPNGLVAGVSLPRGKFIPTLNVEISAGFSLQGKMNILGLKLECDINVNLPSEFTIEAQMDTLTIAGGAIKLSGTDDKSGPYLYVELSTKDGFSLTVKVDCKIQVLKISVGAKINIDDAGFHVEVVGQIGGLFEAKLEINAPYGEFGKKATEEWSVKSCLSNNIMSKAKNGAKDVVQEATNATKAVENENKGVQKDANGWFEKSMLKVNRWKNDLLKLEDRFQADIRQLEQYKKDLDASCVASCANQRTWVGGFGVSKCEIGSKKVDCIHWVNKKTLRESPYCLADCESGKYWIFSWLWNKAKGTWDSAKLIGVEKLMYAKKWLLDRAQDVLMGSKVLVEFAETAAQKVKELKEAMSEAWDAIKKWALENLFYLNKLCIEANLDLATKGLCFNIDADVYLGGKNGKRVIIPNEEVCFDFKWIVKVGAKIAKAAFGNIDKIKKNARKAKEYISKSNSKSKSVKKEVEKAEKRSECSGTAAFGKICVDGVQIDAPLFYPRTEAAYSDVPEILTRNDDTMRAFRDFFTIDKPKADENSETREFSGERDPMDYDLRFLNTTNPVEECGRTDEVLNMYRGISDSVQMVKGKNDQAKKDFEKYMKEHAKKAKELRGRVENGTVVNDVSGDDAENAIFYVDKTDEGLAKWRKLYSSQFTGIDKSSLKSWRNYLAESVAENGMDTASFLNILGAASTTSAQRMDIPGSGFAQSLMNANQIVQNLLANDKSTLSSKSDYIKTLGEEVKKMDNLKKQMPCFMDK